MNSAEFKSRTMEYALQVIELVEELPRTRTADVIGRQLLRSGTSVGANYRAACRAKSDADFISKMGTVEEEADESVYWMELLMRRQIVSQERTIELMSEGDQIVAMTVASIKTARNKKR